MMIAIVKSLHININDYLVDFLQSKLLRHGVAVLLTLCAGLIIWSMVPHLVKATPIVGQAVTQHVRMDIGFSAEKIAAAHLFGQSAADAATTPVVAAAAISIKGLFYSSDKDVARAILEINGKSDVFKTGDRLPNGERLAAIGMNAVQIANGLALRAVEMEQSFGNTGSGIALEGMPNLYARQDSFPGSMPLTNTAAPVVQRLQPVTIPQTNDPISQLSALRQQLIRH
jgi:hypothetical protein